MRFGIAACVVTAACGRIDFSPGADAAGDAGGPVPRVWLTMDDEPGSTVLHDASGWGHDATCTACPTLGVPGMVGTAAQFNGVDDLATIAYASDLDLQAMTIAAWIRIDALPTGYTQIASRQHGPDTDDVWVFGTVHPSIDPARSYQFAVTVAGASTAARGLSSTPDLGTWVHLVGTYDGAIQRLYRDGIEIATAPAPGPIVTDTTDIYVGATNNGAPLLQEYFTGMIDDLRIYATALDATTIAGL